MVTPGKGNVSTPGLQDPLGLEAPPPIQVVACIFPAGPLRRWVRQTLLHLHLGMGWLLVQSLIC